MAAEQSQNDQAQQRSQRKPTCFATPGILNLLERVEEGAELLACDGNALARVGGQARLARLGQLRRGAIGGPLAPPSERTGRRGFRDGNALDQVSHARFAREYKLDSIITPS